MSHLHPFSHDSFLHIRSCSICTHLVMNRPYPFNHDQFTLFRLRSIQTLLIKTPLHFFGHEFFTTFRLRPFALFWSRPISTLPVTIFTISVTNSYFLTLSYSFGNNPFPPFQSWYIHNFSVTICSRPLKHVYTSWIIVRSYLLGYDMFVPHCSNENNIFLI